MSIYREILTFELELMSQLPYRPVSIPISISMLFDNSFLHEILIQVRGFTAHLEGVRLLVVYSNPFLPGVSIEP